MEILRFQNDISIIKLDKTLKRSNSIDWIPVSPRLPCPHETVFLGGWGMVVKGLQATSLQEAILYISEVCPKESSGTICARGDKLTSACPGDSGAGLVRLNQGRPELIGIVSHGSSSCFQGHLVAFTGVHQFINWIQYIIQHYENNDFLT